MDGPDRRYSEGLNEDSEEEDSGFPWTAVCAGVFLVLVMLIGCSVLVVFVRIKLQNRHSHHGDSVHSDSHETMNNLTTNNCLRGDKEVGAMMATSVKNTNKTVDYHSELGGSLGGLSGISSMNGLGGSERNGFKSRYSGVEYNLVHELRADELSLCKEEERYEPEVKCEMLDESDSEETYKKTYSNAAEKKMANSPSCSDSKYTSSCDLNCQASPCDDQLTSDDKCQSTSDTNSCCEAEYQCDGRYQSVYVLSDQKDECIIATEV